MIGHNQALHKRREAGVPLQDVQNVFLARQPEHVIKEVVQRQSRANDGL